MELMIEALKKLILENYTAYLLEVDTPEVPLNMVTDKNITTDDIDIDKYKSNTVMFIIPDRVRFTSLSLTSELVEFETDLFIALRKYSKKTLYTQAMRHMECFKKMVLENSTISNVDIEMTSADFIRGVEGSEDVKGVMIRLKMEIELVFE